MTYAEYWEGEPTLTKAYYQAELLRTQQQSDNMWLQGRYFFEAMSTALSNFGAGLANKHKAKDYRKEPYRVIPKTEKEIEAEKMAEVNARIEQLKAFEAAFKAKKKKESANNG